MPARVVQFSLDSLPTDIPKIFAQVQLTSANHQKNYVALYKLQTEAAKITESVQNGRSIKLVGERAFEDTLLSMLSRALPIKKGESVADRVIKFIGGYTKFINEKGVFSELHRFGVTPLACGTSLSPVCGHFRFILTSFLSE